MEFTNPILKCTNLTKKYSVFTALNDLTLELSTGKIVGLLGPNGSGKTTLMKLLNGLIMPTSGEITINGHSPNEKTKAIVSYLPDKDFINSRYNAKQMCAYYQDFYADFNLGKAYRMLEDFNIPLNKGFKQLSKGMREKVQLALVMSRSALIYCLDEPIGGVDPASREKVLTTIINNYNADSCLIISTHIITDIENILDEAIFLKDGQVFGHYNVDAIREEKQKSLDKIFREVF